MWRWLKNILQTGRGRLGLAGTWLLGVPILALGSGLAFHEFMPPLPTPKGVNAILERWLDLPVREFGLWEQQLPAYQLEPALRVPDCLSEEAALKKIMSLQPVTISESCELTKGEWLDSWSARRITNPDRIRIVETIPVRWLLGAADEARRLNGGASLAATERQQWLVLTPQNIGRLQVVTPRVATRRGNQPIDHFAPWQPEPGCHYAQNWARVKLHYRLPIRPEERDRVANLLRDCR